MPGLFLAGDWTSTGWPATMEGAVRSGYLAAEGVLADLGIDAQLVRPDLPAGRLAKLLLGRESADSPGTAHAGKAGDAEPARLPKSHAGAGPTSRV